MTPEMLEAVVNGGTIGGGAATGAYIMIRFFSSYLSDIRQEIKGISFKFDEILRSLEVMKAKTELEIFHIRDRLESIEKRMDRVEHKE